MMTVEMIAAGVEDKDEYSHKAQHSDTFRVMCLILITADTPLPEVKCEHANSNL